LIHDRTKEVLETLNSSKVSRLATVDPERGQPYVVPVIFTFDGNNIFFPIDDKTKKITKFTLFQKSKKYTKTYQL
jgi:nitroimidazol reductase NimA-like FMN-containing flavoprotein (pyridoxamine 5'-phosphate oxidase superfamily)